MTKLTYTELEANRNALQAEVVELRLALVNAEACRAQAEKLAGDMTSARDIALTVANNVMAERDDARADGKRAFDALCDLYRYVRDHPAVFSGLFPDEHPYQKARVTISTLAAHRDETGKAVAK